MWRKKNRLVLLLPLLLSCLAPEPFGALEVRVERVIDGDTVVCEGLGSVRLLCVDAPERGRPGFEEAKARLEELVLGRVVVLRFDRELRDRWDRLLAWPEVEGVAVGAVLVEEGLAAWERVEPNTRYYPPDAP